MDLDNPKYHTPNWLNYWQERWWGKGSTITETTHVFPFHGYIALEMIFEAYLIILNHDDKDRSIMAALRLIRKWAIISM